MNLEQHFAPFRENIIGIDQCFDTPYGRKPIIYADWIASGRLYAPIEELMRKEIAPFVGNTHTETTVTGSSMTTAYRKAMQIIKQHVNASPHDVLISSNSGMTGVVNKFQRILGMKIAERFQDRLTLEEQERPVIFITHMEHHSNQTSWLETIAEVVIIPPTAEGLVDLEALQALLRKYAHRSTKIASITACSNVTGIETPYHEIAALMHEADGLCFVDFACSAPYVSIDMHPADEAQRLDAIFFSPHKFLGGPGSTGILIFNDKLYRNRVPDHPGGGTVSWTNPWGEHHYTEHIESREDGGTPSFLQTIRVALSIRVKEQMGLKQIHQREAELVEQAFARFDKMDNVLLLAPQHRKRLGVLSFYIPDLHYNLAVKLLNDRFGVQVRGGCSCAGTYGHYLLEISQELSRSITSQIDKGVLSMKPGWVRLSLHPTMTDSELQYSLDAIEAVAQNHEAWSVEYQYDLQKNEFFHKDEIDLEASLVNTWFDSLQAPLMGTEQLNAL